MPALLLSPTSDTDPRTQPPGGRWQLLQTRVLRALLRTALTAGRSGVRPPASRGTQGHSTYDRTRNDAGSPPCTLERCHGPTSSPERTRHSGCREDGLSTSSEMLVTGVSAVRSLAFVENSVTFRAHVFFGCCFTRMFYSCIILRTCLSLACLGVWGTSFMSMFTPKWVPSKWPSLAFNDAHKHLGINVPMQESHTTVARGRCPARSGASFVVSLAIQPLTLWGHLSSVPADHSVPAGERRPAPASASCHRGPPSGCRALPTAHTPSPLKASRSALGLRREGLVRRLLAWLPGWSSRGHDEPVGCGWGQVSRS